MAAKEDITPQATGPEVSINCTPCSEAEKTVKAIKYCVDCTTYVCKDCLNDHNKFAAMRKHKIVEITEVNKIPGDPDQSKGNSLVECESHYGHYIDTYCTNHNEVCCSVCVTIKHRSCKEIQKIEIVVKGIKESQEFRDRKSSLQQFIKFVSQEKADRNQNLRDMTEEKEKLLADVDDHEEKLIQEIRVVANTSRENIRAAHEKHQEAVKTDVIGLDSVMSGLTKSLSQISREDMNEVEAYITEQKCERTLKEIQKVVIDLSNNWLQTTLFYDFKPPCITTLGDVVEETKLANKFHLHCKQSVNIRCQMDSNNCKINGICQLSNQTVVIIDSKNENLKRLSGNLKVKDYIDLYDSPECMCVTKSNEVAIVLQKKRLVQFVTIDENMTLGSTFPIEIGTCSTINYDFKENTIYVSVSEYDRTPKSPIFIIKYDREGQRVAEYVACTNGEPLKIFIKEDTFTFIDACLETFTFHKTGENQRQETKRYVFKSSPRYEFICVPSAGKILTGKKDGDIRLDVPRKRQQKTLQIEGSLPILAVHFNEKNSTLIVAGESNQIKEYKMSIKILKLLRE